MCIKDKIENPWDLTIQVKGDLVNTYREIQRIYKEIYREDLVESHPYVDKQIEQAFEQDLKISRIVSVFAFIAILISLLGLVAMSTYFIQQRSKEIAVRKVFGSTSNQIRRSLIRTFLHYVLIAFAISVPTIWYFMSSWISQYTYRITWWPWIIVAGIIVLIISFSAVAVQSYMASNENPVKHIKQE
ncbi:FtsX-like permease family protein [Hoylesella pleuritidis]|uniref:ABC transporter permease n=1 Tax=Hoylesella pleuritidis TaxID=407975 RepID=UPI0028E1D0BB|nr:FtsX-like permease family protein [Hoylesella pleuritidis]